MDFQEKTGKELEKALRERASTLTSTSPSGILKESEYKCHVCRDFEYVYLVRPDGEKVATECECREQRRIERLIRSSKITPEFRGKRFEGFKVEGRPAAVQAAHQAAQSYVSAFADIRGQRQNSIALLGRPGAGKTHLLVAASNELLDSGVGVIYFPWVEGFNDLKSDWDAANEKVYRLQQADVLFIDDLFKGRKDTTSFQLEQLFGIINFRYLNHKPVLISSERTISEMCEIDEGIGSRIYEMCKRYTVTLQGGLELNYRLSEP